MWQVTFKNIFWVVMMVTFLHFVYVYIRDRSYRKNLSCMAPVFLPPCGKCNHAVNLSKFNFRLSICEKNLVLSKSFILLFSYWFLHSNLTKHCWGQVWRMEKLLLDGVWLLSHTGSFAFIFSFPPEADTIWVLTDSDNGSHWLSCE